MAVSFQVTFDCADPDAQARFWAAALDYILQPPPAGYADWESFLTEQGMAHLMGQASAIVDPAGTGPRIFFQRVPEQKTVKNRVHLDLNVSDARRAGPEEGKRRRDETVQRLIGLGASVVRAFEEHGETWTIMRDPEGNEFCVQ
ncbi:MAG TPA: VOC family protein [Chloroflexota bacterium]|jgi:hypothetical protein|nr:VOC family protein [Chloroflexota bacterium]